MISPRWVLSTQDGLSGSPIPQKESIAGEIEALDQQGSVEVLQETLHISPLAVGEAEPTSESAELTAEKAEPTTESAELITEEAHRQLKHSAYRLALQQANKERKAAHEAWRTTLINKIDTIHQEVTDLLDQYQSTRKSIS